MVMRTMLVFPPQGDPCQPYSSIPYLMGTLRKAGHQVKPVDLNLITYQYFTDTQRLSKAYEYCLSAFNDLDGKPFLKVVDLERYGFFSLTSLCGPSVMENLPEALKVFRDGSQFYDVNMYSWALKTIQRALEIASGPFYPSRLGLQSYSMRYSSESSAGITSAVADNKENMFKDLFRSQFIPILRSEDSQTVGISITYPTQVIAAFTLARVIREQFPDLPIILGGATLSKMFKKLKEAPELLSDVNYLVLYEGETALLRLLDALEKGKPLSSLPNLAIVEEGRIVETGVNHVEVLDDLPAPDFDGLPLDQYWSPKVVPLLNIARGCYWGKCAFCTFSAATWGKERKRKDYRFCSPGKVARDIEALSKKYGTDCFNFAIDAMPTSHLLKLSETLTESGVSITWDSEVRLEKGFTADTCRRLYESGCRHLRFGFETACDRVSDLIRKGIEYRGQEKSLGTAQMQALLYAL